MRCPRCGTGLQAGATCPACGWALDRTERQAEQQVTGRVDGTAGSKLPDPCEGPAAPAPEVPVPYPNTDRASDHGAKSVKVDGEPVSAPDTEYVPSEGDEPGTGVPGMSRLPGGVNPLLVAGIVIAVVVVVVVFVHLMAGDGNGNGDDGPDGELSIDPLETTVAVVWEPAPGLHLAIALLNEANTSLGMDGHSLLVTVMQGTEEVGRTTMALSGDVAAGGGRGVLVDVAVDLTSGQEYDVRVLLRDGGGRKVDEYRTEVTVQAS